MGDLDINEKRKKKKCIFVHTPAWCPAVSCLEIHILRNITELLGASKYLLSSSAITFPLRLSHFPYSVHVAPSSWKEVLLHPNPTSFFGAWMPTQPTCLFQRLHKVFCELWHPGLHLLPVWGCLSNWSVSLLPTASSIFTAQSRIWHVTGIRETSVQLLNEPAISYLYTKHALHQNASLLCW